MVAYSFRGRFAQQILDGTKGGTIRADRKRHARPGEELQLYTGMRTKQCRLIARRTCLSVEPIAMAFDTDPMVRFGGRMPIYMPRLLNIFARFDGFRDFDELRQFWAEEHETLAVFSGQHIRWLPLPEEIA